ARNRYRYRFRAPRVWRCGIGVRSGPPELQFLVEPGARAYSCAAAGRLARCSASISSSSRSSVSN
ncbi:hypothetical protein, partial [Streptomyces sp. NPDC058632]|uniref:hypothetical protein n=1 Tax=Streptomyces sp. NPDC058632 TaxID=3346567 RepID=UPI0036493DA7